MVETVYSIWIIDAAINILKIFAGIEFKQLNLGFHQCVYMYHIKIYWSFP